MTKKRQIKLTEPSLLNESNKKTKSTTFDEIAAIIQSGESEKLRKIIEDGGVSDINMVGNTNNTNAGTFLTIACESGFTDCARVLLDHKANINIVPTSVLKNACLSGNTDMLRFIIERGVPLNDTVIHYLFSSTDSIVNAEVSTILVGHIQNVQWAEKTDNFLYLVCKAGHVDAARLLLERGARREGNNQFRDPLKIACSSGHVEVVRCLVEYGASVAALTSALVTTIEYRHLEIAAILVNNGAEFNTFVPMFGCSIWVYLCRRGSPDLVRLLLARGADPISTAAMGGSPLRAALWYPVVMQILLEHGANPNEHYTQGATALLDMLRYLDETCTETLPIMLAHGADPNLAHATTGQTPLMKAALLLRVDLVKLLLEHGADVTQVNREGQSVLDMLGRTRKYGEVRELCTRYIECNKPGAKLLLK